MNMLWWIFCGAAGLWIGMPNPVASFPAAALLYPASLSPAWDRFHKLETRFPARLALRPGGGLGLPLLAGHPGSRLRGAAVGARRTLPAAHGRVYRPVRRPVRRAGPCPEGGTGMAEGCGARGSAGILWNASGAGSSPVSLGLRLASAFTPWTPVIQLASVIGAYGLGGLLAGLSCLCAEGILRVRHPHALRKRWLPALGGSLAGIFLVVAFGVFSLSFAPSGRRRAVGILGAGQP